jgi:hypothetical protein
VWTRNACWAQAGPPQAGKRAQTTLERWQQIHDLPGKGIGLLEHARRLDLALNTVKRYARAERPERLQRRRSTGPRPSTHTVTTCAGAGPRSPHFPVQQMLREIRELGYQGSSNLLVCHINQGRVEGDRAHLSPCRTTRLLLTVPAVLTAGQHETLAGITGAWTEMTVLAGLVSSFVDLLTPDLGRAGLLTQWITAARRGLPQVHAFARGLDLDIQAATAALTLPHHNGRTEGRPRALIQLCACQACAACRGRLLQR